MDFKFLLYMFGVAVLITGGAYYFFSDGQMITAAMYFSGALVAAIYFGFRWFTASGDTTDAYKGKWPPTINYCPDFLTLYTVDSKQVCIDPIGITSGGIKKWTDPTQTSSDYLFDLHLDKSGNLRIKALCDECSSKRVTWEGVFDGSVCLYNDPPRPPSAAASS